MMKRGIMLVAAVVIVGSTAQAVDQVKKLAGTTVSGTFKTVGKNEVEIEKTVGGPEKIPVTEIDFIAYDGEPPLLRGIRGTASSGQFTTALQMLGRINPADAVKPEAKAEIAYYKAYCEGRLALAGSGKVDESGKAMIAYLTANPNSYHFYTGTLLVADLLVKARQYDAALTYYAQLDGSTFAELKMRAGVGKGQTMVAQSKFPEALTEFEKVLAISNVKGDQASRQQFAASLGKAFCIASQGKPDDGIKLIEETIKKVSPEDAELMAQAYVALGKCYLLKPEAKKQALIAFLHVDTLYPNQPVAHAESLKNLDVLWRELGKPERALQAISLLQERYGAVQ